jgi:peptidoglycan hydrolase-like protein with peptidoglycan-binding domain
VFDTAMSKWTTWKQVRILERKLQRLWYLPKDRVITGVYDGEVIEAVWTFQLEMWLLDDTAPYPVRGFFGEKTREKINGL